MSIAQLQRREFQHLPPQFFDEGTVVQRSPGLQRIVFRHRYSIHVGFMIVLVRVADRQFPNLLIEY
jgi:hypothetical protein